MSILEHLKTLKLADKLEYLHKSAGWIGIPCRVLWNGLEKQLRQVPRGWTKLKFTDIKPHIKCGHNACILRTGQDVGIVGIDVDDIDTLNLIWRYMNPGSPIPENKNYFDTFTCESGGKNCGLHFIFKYHPSLPRNKQDLKWVLDESVEELGIDVRSTGGGLLFHPTKAKRAYSICPFSSFDNIREVPHTLLRFLIQDQGVPHVTTDAEGITEVQFRQIVARPVAAESAPLTTDVFTKCRRNSSHFWKTLDSAPPTSQYEFSAGVFSFKFSQIPPGHLGCGCTSDNTYLKINTHNDSVRLACQAEGCDQQRIIRRSLRYYLDCSDVGFANLCEDRLFGQVYYNELTQCYYVWDARTCLWKVDRKGAKLRTLINTVLAGCIDTYNKGILSTMTDSKERDIILRRITQMRKQVRTNSCLNNISQYLRGSSFISEDFFERLNRIPHLIPIKGGYAMDLHTGKKRRRTQADYFSFELKFDYTPGDFGPFPAWFRSLFDFYKDVDECVQFLQMYLGYCISGETREQCFTVFRGNKGKNGKGVILNLMEHIMGDFIYKMNKGLVVQSEKCSNRGASLAKLVSSRLAYIDETTKEDRFRDDFVKDISGEGKITYRPLYQSEQTIATMCKLLCLTNYAPKFDGTDQAIVRRIMIIPFEKYFRTKHESGFNAKDKYCVEIRDNNLKYELMDQAPKFFNWVVAGAIAYFRSIGNLMNMLPRSFKRAKERYIHENDPVQQFIEDFCELGEDFKVPVTGFQTKLRKEYGLSINDYSSQCISKIMQDKGFEKKNQRSTYMDHNYNTKHYIGIRICLSEEDY